MDISINDFWWIKEEYTGILEWLETVKSGSLEEKKDIKRACFFYGPPGIGKTTLARKLLLEKDYTIIELNASNHRSMKKIQKIMKEISTKSNVSKLIHGRDNPTAIIMDEVDGLSVGEKSGLNILLNYLKLKTEHFCPLICISNEKIDKKLKELKKLSNTYYFEHPTYNDMLKIGKSICEKLEQKYCINGLKRFVEHSNGDIRVFYNLINLHQIDCNELLSKETANITISKLSKQHFYSTTTDYIKRCIGAGLEYDVNLDKHQFSITEKSMISMIIHENLPKILNSNKKLTETEKREIFLKCSEYYCIVDKWNNDIFNKQKWEHVNLIENICIYPILNILKDPNYKYEGELKFTKVLGKHNSIYSSFKMNKRFSNLLNVNNLYWIEYLPYICDRLLYEKDRDNYTYCKELLGAGFKFNDIEKFFKYNYLIDDDSVGSKYIKHVKKNM